MTTKARGDIRHVTIRLHDRDELLQRYTGWMRGPAASKRASSRFVAPTKQRFPAEAAPLVLVQTYEAILNRSPALVYLVQGQNFQLLCKLFFELTGFKLPMSATVTRRELKRFVGAAALAKFEADPEAMSVYNHAIQSNRLYCRKLHCSMTVRAGLALTGKQLVLAVGDAAEMTDVLAAFLTKHQVTITMNKMAYPDDAVWPKYVDILTPIRLYRKYREQEVNKAIQARQLALETIEANRKASWTKPKPLWYLATEE